jgi:hypothetical protein
MCDSSRNRSISYVSGSSLEASFLRKESERVKNQAQ